VKAFILVLLTLLLSVPSVKAQTGPEDFRETLSKATVAVYVGKQVCEYKTVETFFMDIPEWRCQFESHFTCTATVVRTDGDGGYIGLTAGHCFSYDKMEEGYKYYISDGVNLHPTLREIRINKFESNDQYDYGIFQFKSGKEYPVIQVAGVGRSVMTDVIPALGVKVLNVNFSYGIVKQVVEGTVVSHQISETESSEDGRLRRRYLVQIPIGPGASGSAVVDESTHEIVGLAEAIFPGTQMAAAVIPTGTNLSDFWEDDSVGMKPLPEPKPVTKEEDKSLSARVRAIFNYFLRIYVRT